LRARGERSRGVAVVEKRKWKQKGREEEGRKEAEGAAFFAWHVDFFKERTRPRKHPGRGLCHPVISRPKNRKTSTEENLFASRVRWAALGSAGV
jgi:hypothetical protein